jgi:hypothetical protein
MEFDRMKTNVADPGDKIRLKMAIRSVRLAHLRSLKTGAEVLYVKNGKLYSVRKGQMPVVLRIMPKRVKVKVGKTIDLK